MLYSNSYREISKDKSVGRDSYFSTDRVFTGTYWDEFSLVCVETEFPRVLVLGAGEGACVRPILSAMPNAQITLVDYDRKAVERLKQNYAQHFPKIRFKVVASDAVEVLKRREEFNLIWVDLYDDVGFAPCMGEERFYDLVVNRLSAKGSVAFNISTVPVNLIASKLGPSESFVLKKLLARFETTKIYPYRRNLTIVASSEQTLSQTTFRSDAVLQEIDRLVFNLNRFREGNSDYKPSLNEEEKLLSFDETNRLMTELWSKQQNFDISMLQSQLTSEPASAGLISEIFLSTSYECSVIPVLMGSLCQGRYDLAKAYVNWFFDHVAWVFKLGLGRDLFITQVFAVMAQHSGIWDQMSKKAEQFICSLETERIYGCR